MYMLLPPHCPSLQLALGSILRQGNARELPCGVFGSFGWSGEAVDEMEAKLKDGGYGFAFDPIKVKFKPTTKVSDLAVFGLIVVVCFSRVEHCLTSSSGGIANLHHTTL